MAMNHVKDANTISHQRDEKPKPKGQMITSVGENVKKISTLMYHCWEHKME